MPNKKKGSRKDTWKIDARIDNAIDFAINDVLSNAENSLKYSSEERMQFVHLAMNNLIEAIHRFQTNVDYIPKRNIFKNMIESALDDIYTVFANIPKDDINFPEIDVFPSHMICQNSYNKEFIEYDEVQKEIDLFAERHKRKGCRSHLASKCFTFAYPRIYIRFKNTVNPKLEYIETGDIMLTIDYLFHVIIKYSMPENLIDKNNRESENYLPTMLYNIMNKRYSKEPESTLLSIPDKDDFMSLVNFIHDIIDGQNAHKYKIISAGFTGYRLGSPKNPIIQEFITLSKNTPCNIYLETSARGECQNNLAVIDALLNEGNPDNLNIKINYHDIKVHGKMMYFDIQYSDESKIKRVSIFSTGNFNPKTAKSYKDYIYITTSDEISLMMQNNFTTIFNSAQPALSSISSIVIHEILAEIEKGKSGRIWIQSNHLDNEYIVRLLKEAQSRGVDVKLIIRTTKGFHAKDKLKYKTVTGKYLEHRRVYIFGKRDNRVYLSSSDLMYRNLYNRFESYVLIPDTYIKFELINDFKNLWSDGQ